MNALFSFRSFAHAHNPSLQLSAFQVALCREDTTLVAFASLALALQLNSPAAPADAGEPLVQQVQYRGYPHPPPCGHGKDLSVRDGLCYPNGVLPPEDQAAFQRYYRQGYDNRGYGRPGYGGPGYGQGSYGGGVEGRGYGGGRYPVPCGHGADLDTRDGRCYPNGSVPPQFQSGAQRYYRY